MSDSSVRVRHITGLGSGRATTDILLVHDHRGLTDAIERRSVGDMSFGVGRCSLESRRSFTLRDDASSGAMHLDVILSGLEAFVHRGAVLESFRKRPHVLVIGMTAADGRCGLDLLVPGIVDRLSLDRPQTLF